MRDVFKVSVQGLIYNKNKEILLLKRDGKLSYGNMYSLPGGHLEKSESIVDGMIRELKEEIGVEFKPSELELIKVINRRIKNDNYIDFVFIGNLNDRKVSNLEKDRCQKIIYRTIDKLPRNSIPVLKRITKDNNLYITMEEK